MRINNNVKSIYLIIYGFSFFFLLGCKNTSENKNANFSGNIFFEGKNVSEIKQVHYFGEKYDRVYLIQKDGYKNKILWFERTNELKQQIHTSYYANQLVVKLDVNDSKSLLLGLLGNIEKSNSIPVTITDSIPERNIYELTFHSNTLVSLSEMKDYFEKANFIKYTTPNYLAYPQQVPNQSMVEYDPNQWAYRNNSVGEYSGMFDSDADGLEAISKNLWGREQKTPVLVSVIDGGIDIYHPALKPVLYVNKGEIHHNGIDDDHNGMIDDVNGWNFISNDFSLGDPTKHGTHVAGIIAARPASSIKMRGVSPNAVIISCKAINELGEIKLLSAAKAIDYSVLMKAEIINMSFRSFDHFQPFFESIYQASLKDIVMVAAAGNDKVDLSVTPVYPACYTSVFSVAATDQNDNIATFSNYTSSGEYGNHIVRLGAPGVEIFSTVPVGSYEMMSGTSMAAPMVTGTVALIKSINPNISRTTIIRKLEEGADRITALTGKVIQNKRLNIYKAVYQPSQTYDQFGIAYHDQIYNGYARWSNFPYANSNEPGIDGSSYEKAYAICTMKQLFNIRNEDLNKHFKIMNNLDWNELDPFERRPIDKIFTGKYMGVILQS